MERTHTKVDLLKTDILPRSTKKALDLLAKQKWMKRANWYLAGGTALAMHLGHRRSVDLDFFSTKSRFASSTLITSLEKLGWQTDILREGTLFGRLLGAKVSFIALPLFVPKEPMKHYGNVKVLSSSDIAVMKVIAISQRGRKRDFLDLYWYATYCEPLLDVMKRLPSQYPKVAHDFHHIIKSLQYFADADEDQMPRTVSSVSWVKVKRFFQHEALKLMEGLIL